MNGLFVSSFVRLFVSFGGLAERRQYETFEEELTTLKQKFATDNGRWILKRACEDFVQLSLNVSFIQKEKQKKVNLGQLLFEPLVLFWGPVLH